MVVFSNLGFIYPNCESAISKTFVKIPGIKIKVLELAMELLDELYLWVENKQYTTSNKTHGLTTLK